MIVLVFNLFRFFWRVWISQSRIITPLKEEITSFKVIVTKKPLDSHLVPNVGENKEYQRAKDDDLKIKYKLES